MTATLKPIEQPDGKSAGIESSAWLGRIVTTHPAFTAGYMAGCDDPGFSTATQPAKIENPHPAGTLEHAHYAAGYWQAIH